MHEWAELRHFRYLLKVLEKQSFRAAAEELHTSQPNLTVQARRFQDFASVRLYQKLKNGRIRPTATGIAFVSLARLLLDMRDEVIDALIAIEHSGIRAPRFGCTPLVDPGLFRNFCAAHQSILPERPIRLTIGDTEQIAEEIANGTVDAALVTLPLTHPDLHIEELRRDRLVVCLRRDHPLASKGTLKVEELQGRLTILHHPKRHPSAHAKLLRHLAEAGIKIEDFSDASHPSEMLMLVKQGLGFTLIREGTPLEEELTTRPIVGVNWTVETAVVYHKQQHPRTLPILVRLFRKQLGQNINERALATTSMSFESSGSSEKKPVQGVGDEPAQLKLYG